MFQCRVIFDWVFLTNPILFSNVLIWILNNHILYIYMLIYYSVDILQKHLHLIIRIDHHRLVSDYIYIQYIQYIDHYLYCGGKGFYTLQYIANIPYYIMGGGTFIDKFLAILFLVFQSLSHLYCILPPWYPVC